MTIIESSAFCVSSEEAEKTTANVEDCLETVFTGCASLDHLVGARPAAFGQFLDGSFQYYWRYLRTSFPVPRHKLCRTFSKFPFTQIDVPKASVARLRILTGGSADAAVVVAKGTAGVDPPWGSEPLRLKATADPFFSNAPEAGAVYVSVPLTKSA